jgi:hypothetical protein
MSEDARVIIHGNDSPSILISFKSSLALLNFVARNIEDSA